MKGAPSAPQWLEDHYRGLMDGSHVMATIVDGKEFSCPCGVGMSDGSNFGRAATFAMDKLLIDPLSISVCAYTADFNIIVSRPIEEAEKARDMMAREIEREMERECRNS